MLLPLTLNVPFTFAPVPVTINCAVALPTAVRLILLSATIVIPLLPFATLPIKLPTVALPETLKPVRTPTLVMLGCAAVVTVPAVVAELAVP